MRLLVFISLFALCLHAQSVLVIQSNSEVKKYTQAVDEFTHTFTKPFKTLDISRKSSKEIQKALYDEYPDIVYAVGAKAYLYANEYLPEKEIYFSSVVDWKRLPLKGKRYGVSNELHSGMQLTLIKSIFNTVKTIGVVHSQYTQNSIDDLRRDGENFGIKILPIKIDEGSVNSLIFDDILQQCDAMMIISDPLFINSEQAVANLFLASKEAKKPVITYHELFIPYGATLAISADDLTTGRQIATMIEGNMNEESTEKIQYPAGTNILFNKKDATLIGIEFTPDITSIVTEIIE